MTLDDNMILRSPQATSILQMPNAHPHSEKDSRARGLVKAMYAGRACWSERWFRLKSAIHWLAVWLWVFSAIIKDKSVKVFASG